MPQRCDNRLNLLETIIIFMGSPDTPTSYQVYKPSYKAAVTALKR